MPHFAVASTSSAASSLLNGLNAAAEGQAAQQRLQANTQAAQDRQDQQDYFKAVQDGWVPAQAETRLPGGLIDRSQPAQANMDPARMATIAGRQMYKPTASEQEQAGLNDSNSFIPSGQLGDMLAKAGVKPGSRIKAGDSHSILQALNDSQMEEPYDIDTSGKFQDAQGKPAAVMIGRKTGTVRMLNMGNAQASGSPSPGAAPGGAFDTSDDPGQPGQPAQPGVAQSDTGTGQPGGGFSFAPQKADKPDLSQILQGVQGPNGGPLIFDHTTQTLKEIPPVPGSKGVLTAAQTEADKDRHVRQSELDDARNARQAAVSQAAAEKAAKGVDAVRAKHEDIQSKEQDQWYLKGQYDRLRDPTQTPDGTAVTLPNYNPNSGEVKDGQTVVMNKDLRSSLAGLSSQAERKAGEHQKAAAGIRKSMGWGEFAPTQAPVQPAQRTVAPAAGNAPAAPPAAVTKALPPGTHTFGNKQVWRKNPDGSMNYIGGGQ